MQNLAIKLFVVLLSACLTIGFILVLKTVTHAPEGDMADSEISTNSDNESDTSAFIPENDLEEYLRNIPVKPPVIKERGIICEFGCDGTLIIKSEPEYQIVYRATPDMPEDAQRSGHCTFDLEVGTDGRVSDIMNITCSDIVFDKSSYNSALKWVFRPKIISGKRVSFLVKNMRIKYLLLDEDGHLIPE